MYYIWFICRKMRNAHCPPQSFCMTAESAFLQLATILWVPWRKSSLVPWWPTTTVRPSLDISQVLPHFYQSYRLRCFMMRFMIGTPQRHKKDYGWMEVIYSEVAQAMLSDVASQAMLSEVEKKRRKKRGKRGEIGEIIHRWIFKSLNSSHTEFEQAWASWTSVCLQWVLVCSFKKKFVSCKIKGHLSMSWDCTAILYKIFCLLCPPQLSMQDNVQCCQFRKIKVCGLLILFCSDFYLCFF